MTDLKKDALEIVKKSVNDFTIAFHKNVADEKEGNFVSSALSAHVVLAMTLYGAQGTTAKQMRKALYLPNKHTKIHLGIQNFIDNFNNAKNVILKLANKMYINNKITVKADFLKITESYFRSQSESIDVSMPCQAVRDINQWCIEKTNGKIKDIINEGDITKDLALVLLNTIYFKGNWKEPFHERDTIMKPFHFDKNTTIQVPTMHITETFPYKTIDELDAECIRLPYVNKDFIMEIIVPRKVDGLAFIEKNLEKIRFDDKKQYLERGMHLSIPKFKIKTTIDLKSHLEEMGMGEIFTDKAKFGGISDSTLKVDKVVQKAYIEVNEMGCEAAAVTIEHLVPEGDFRYPSIDVNRPFLYYIIFKNTILFSGRVTNPEVHT